MRLGVRGKLFLTSLAVVVIVVGTSAVFLEVELRDGLESRIESELLRQAETARAVVQVHSSRTIATLDPLVDELGAAMSARVTVIDSDGTVIGDSNVDLQDIERLENHANRPEVVAAHLHGRGSSRRYSTTLATDMLYVAVAVEGGTVRMSKPLSEVDEAVSQLRKRVFVAGLFGIAVALLMTGLASHYLSRALRELVATTRKIAEGSGSHRVSVSSGDELGSLASSINRMSEEMGGLVADLAHERDRFEAVLEGMAEAVIALDNEQRINLVNESARTLIERDEPLEGQRLSDVLRMPPVGELLAALRNGEHASFELQLGESDLRVVEAHGHPMKSSAGAVVVLRDVTRVRQLEAIRRDFIANASHELRTPISLIRANAETLLDGALEDRSRRRDFVEAQLRSAERMSHLIAELLDLSRIESGKHTLELVPEPVGPALDRAFAALRPRAEEKHQTLEASFEVGHRVLADSPALDQVLFNLVDNAVKYTQEGGHVSVTSVAVDGGVRIEVCDDGPGIAPEHRERIFERFYRVDPGRSRAMGGTGLGLAIVKHLAVAMGGRVGVSAATAKGSVFWLELPAAPADRSA